jgi:hypothetical protein
VHPQETIDIFNSKIAETIAKDDLHFTYNTLKKSVGVELSPDTEVSLSESLGILLGFGGSKTLKSSLIGPYPIDLDIGFFSIYVYCDIVPADQIIGTTLSPLLRCIPLRGKDGDRVSETFILPYYRPIVRNSFHEISIYLRDDTGKKIPFSPNGRVNVTLHFKRSA